MRTRRTIAERQKHLDRICKAMEYVVPLICSLMVLR